MAIDMFGFPVKSNAQILKIDPETFAFYLEGAIFSNVSTGQPVPGSVRGLYAVDLQQSRNTSGKVASGQASICVGTSNTASALNSIAIGQGNTASNTAATSLGISNNCSGSGSAALGNGNASSGTQSMSVGTSNASSATSSVAMGGSTTASGASSTTTGFGSNTFSIVGRTSHASGIIAVTGDSQKSSFSLRQSTTDATPTTVTGDALTATATNGVTLSNNTAYSFMGQVVCRQSAAGGTTISSWKFEGLINREGTAASTVLITSTVTAISNVSAMVGPVFTANTTLGSLACTVTGVAATNIRWHAYIDTVEILYA